MFGSETDNKVTDVVEHALDSLRELEKSTADAVQQLRSTQRIEVRMKVQVQPANAGERPRYRVEGLTGDVSSGGCQILTPTPLRVGDVYFISFARTKDWALPQVYARCMRCRVIREDAFESGFAFFNPIDLGQSAESDDAGDLLV